MSIKPTLLMFATDPGGANIVASLEKIVSRQYSTCILARKAAFLQLRQILPNKEVHMLNDEYDQYSIPVFLEVLANIDPIAVVTDTTGRDYSCRTLWQSCKKRGTPCIAIIDQWMNYSLRFLKEHSHFQKRSYYGFSELVLPDEIVTMDEASKEQMIKEGIPHNIIHALGSPYYQFLAEKNKTKVHNDNINIIFASEPITAIYGHSLGRKIHGYTEKSILHSLCKSIEIFDKKEVITLSIRKHPRESKLRYKSILSRYKFVRLCQEHKAEKSIAQASMVIGMSSTMLLEGALQSKPIISLQIANHGKSPFYLEQIKLTNSIRYTFQLKRLIKDIMMKRLAKYKLEMPYKKSAAEEILLLIHQLSTTDSLNSNKD